MVSMTFKLNEPKMNKIALKQGQEETDKISSAIYEESQSKCPVETENLKQSGYKQKIEKGFNVGYSADYAGIVDKTPQKGLKNGKTHFLSGTYKKYGKGVSSSEL